MKQLDIQEYTGLPVFLDNKLAAGEVGDETPANYLKICSNGIFRCSKNGMMESIVKLEGIPSGTLNEGKDNAVWCGPKLSLEDFHFIKALFIKVYSMIKTECDVQLEYSPSLNKVVIRLPHQTVSGGHVSWEAQDDDVFWIDRQLVDPKDLPTDLEHIGRVHSHNVMSAFWSSTDTGDQVRQERGIQIVMGKITTEFEYKCRVVNCGNTYDCEPHDVLDIPPVVMPEVPEGIIKVVTPASTSTTYYGGYGNYHWDSKTGTYQPNNAASKDAKNAGGNAANGGTFHKSYPQYPNGSPWGDGYDDNYDYPSNRTDYVDNAGHDQRPFDKGGRATVKRAPRTAKTATAGIRIIKPNPAANATTSPNPMAYLISGIISAPFSTMPAKELAELAEGYDDPIDTALRQKATVGELRRVMSFEANHQALFCEPTDISSLVPQKSIDFFTAIFEAAKKGRSDNEVVADCLKNSSLNLAHAIRCFTQWYPLISRVFMDQAKHYFGIDMDKLHTVVVPKGAGGEETLKKIQGALLDIEEVAFITNIKMFPYILSTQFSEANDRKNYLFRFIATEVE